MPKVSIIIPVYNCAKYLPKCLESLINQTFKDIEIICINDGSLDNSLNVLNDYAQKDNRVIVISQENSKQGSARNKGLDTAKGEFITFVDSDDWIDIDYIEKLYFAIVDNDADLSIASIKRVKKHAIRDMFLIKEKNVITNTNKLLQAIDWNLNTTGKMYKYSNISKLRFMEEVSYEDAPYTLRAINNSSKGVFVPNIYYYYYSRPNSTIKAKQTEANRNDIIETQIDLINYAKENNIILKDNLIYKDCGKVFKTKYYINKIEKYFLGIKINTKYQKFKDEKIFVVICLAFFGDVIVTDLLFQNIKRMYPNSKTIFIVNKPWFDVAKNLKDVDEVIPFDKRGEHKGFYGIFKFIKHFPYKNIDYIFQLAKNERIMILSKLLRPRLHLIEPENISDIKIINRRCLNLKKITHKKIIEVPIVYQTTNEIPENFKNIIFKNKKYVALCTTTKREEKDMPLETIIDLVKKLSVDYEVLFVGSGEKALKQSVSMDKNGLKYINLINKTSIIELAQILKNCSGLISVDTGTMHFAYANNVPVLCVFYENNTIQHWAPDNHLYPFTLYTQETKSEDIYKSFNNLQNNYINKEVV